MDNCSSVGSKGVRQFLQIVRTKRWPNTAINVEEIKNGSTPMSTNRVTAPGESFVCSVLKTKCPVNDACTEIWAVSKSRISPTMMMSGSCRKKDRNALPKVIPNPSLMATCMMPSISNSTGSSAVNNLESIVLTRRKQEYNVVVLPQPVGPVTTKMPLGRWMTSLIKS